MKLSISYTLFDAEEWLEASVSQVRDYADIITVIFQEVSNFGDTCSPELVPLLKKLYDKGMIDKIHRYDPQLNGRGDLNELCKRQHGLEIGRQHGCTHHMSMDVDELYTKEEIEYVIREVEKHDYDSCACQMLTYYKKPCYILDPPEEYYVPLMYKIVPQRNFVFAYPFPVVVDPTRRMPIDNCRIFKRSEIQMHHMSYVRNDMAKKLNNSSAKVNWESIIPDFVERFNHWTPDQKAIMPGPLPFTEYNTIKVNQLFSTVDQ